MKIKSFFLGGLVITLYLVLMLTNLALMSGYFSAYRLWKNGERITVIPIELLRSPGHGYKGYRYKVEYDRENGEIYSKNKLDLNAALSVVVLPDRPEVVFRLDDSDGFLAAYRAVTGGWLISVLFAIMHVGVLRVTWIACVKIPLDCIRTTKLTKSCT